MHEHNWKIPPEALAELKRQLNPEPADEIDESLAEIAQWPFAVVSWSEAL